MHAVGDLLMQGWETIWSSQIVTQSVWERWEGGYVSVSRIIGRDPLFSVINIVILFRRTEPIVYVIGKAISVLGGKGGCNSYTGRYVA